MSQTMTSDQITTPYGRTLDFDGGAEEILCPPESVYTFLVKEASDPIEKAGFNEGDVDIQVNYTCELQGYPYDPTDEDDYDFNGMKVTAFIVVGRQYKGKDSISPVWRSTHEKAKSPPFFKATIPEYPWTDEEAMKKTPLNVDLPVGRKFRALVTPNKKGYPNLSNFMPAKAGKPKKAAPPPPPDDMDEEEDSALYDD